MRRSPLCFAFAGLELARFFILASVAARLASVQPGAPQILRLVAAPNVLFALGFLFLGLDARRYASYRPLLAVGKAVALLSSAIAAPRLIAAVATTGDLSASMLLGVGAWDAFAGAFLAFGRPAAGSPTDEPRPASPEPERVELD